MLSLEIGRGSILVLGTSHSTCLCCNPLTRNISLSLSSRHGHVNVYNPDTPTFGSSSRVNPLKTISNLTTSVTSLTFNHDSQLLAVASDTKKDQMRMVSAVYNNMTLAELPLIAPQIHLPSLTAFSNWPTSSTPLGLVTSMDFSSRSEYIAVGNTRGRVLLYTLRDFVDTS